MSMLNNDVADLELRLMDGQRDVTCDKIQRGRVQARLTGNDDEFCTVCDDTETDSKAAVDCRSYTELA